ncbi:hypothetical protein AAFF_G00291420 [Aldrovandia affinis]|uniref:EGF-like domain-containing protein n=1 Tax=Aldrovandia affinis TaxID=143900 RepID=A0AAD7SS92_9TELE|nr:hypothetical protein AAFF_G00291420 [Aldrovandia affinis]
MAWRILRTWRKMKIKAETVPERIGRRLPFHIPSLLLLLYLTNGVVNCQTACSRPGHAEWHPRPQSVHVRWSLAGGVCSDVAQCWGVPKDTAGGETSPFPQLCPLHLQLGDGLLLSPDWALIMHGIRLLNVSEEDFQNCTSGPPRDLSLQGNNANGTMEVDPRQLSAGTHYFSSFHQGSTQLCRVGLRLNVTVKRHLCRGATSEPLCSGRGACRSQVWDYAYRCRCHAPYSGQFCERVHACALKPCANGGTCVSTTLTYGCLCPSNFTGINCSEVIGNCDNGCLNGRCHQVTPNSFRCVCDPGSTGPICEEKITYCDSTPCKNGALCRDGLEAYVCECPGGFTGHDCEINCTSHVCQRQQACVAEENKDVCACTDGVSSVQCRDQRGPCGPGPCLNNGSCLSLGTDYHCRCPRGFTGKNCEEVSDYCKLLNISCLNEGLCLNRIGGYNCLCAPGWTGEACQHVENACLIYPDNCLHGATCMDTSHPGAGPQYTCTCLRGYTGEHCEMEVNECNSDPCQHNGTCADLVGRHSCTCPIGFLGENCEVDVDACVLPNATCPPESLCLDLPEEFRYTCRTPCPPHTQPCANGGRCFLDDVERYSCVCTPGWTGHTCLENIEDCVKHWCQNGATCVDEVGGYRCLCHRGFTGAYCEQDINYCIGNLCSVHGTCLDHHDNYTCHCMLGYEGRYCELEKDECRSYPCTNGATCVDVVGGYLCHCLSGFEGTTCAENVNYCWSRPCVNQGTCLDQINNYTCICPSGK